MPFVHRAGFGVILGQGFEPLFAQLLLKGPANRSQDTGRLPGFRPIHIQPQPYRAVVVDAAERSGSVAGGEIGMRLEFFFNSPM